MPVKVDTRRLMARVTVLEGNVHGALKQMGLAHVREFVWQANAMSPRDTHRYVRGWQMAGRDLGVWAAVEPVQKSARAELHIDVLERQITRLEVAIGHVEAGAAEKRRLVDLWFTSRGRKLTPGGRRMQRDAVALETRARQMYKLLGRAEEELAKYNGAEGAILIDAGKHGQGHRVKPTHRYGGDPARKYPNRSRRLTTVRDKVYGGQGSWQNLGGRRMVFTLHNMEPHASFVERKSRVRAKARAAAMTRVPPGVLHREGKKALLIAVR